MVIFLSILLCVLLITCWISVLKTRRTVGELQESVRLSRCMLLNESSASMKRLGLPGLIRETNGLIDRYRGYLDVESGLSNQLEAMLGSIQEAVIIFNDQHVIEFVNDSAQRLFQRARTLKGARLETALRSPSLLEFLNAYREDHSPKRQEVSVERLGEVLWFEVSCVAVRGVSAQDAESPCWCCMTSRG